MRFISINNNFNGATTHEGEFGSKKARLASKPRINSSAYPTRPDCSSQAEFKQHSDKSPGSDRAGRATLAIK